MKKHDENQDIRSLSKKKDIRFNFKTYTMEILNNGANNKANDLGNGSWGKIDFLVNHCGWKRYFVSQFTKNDFVIPFAAF